MWTNTPECVPSEGNTRKHLSATRLTSALLGIAMASGLAMKEKGQPTSSVRGSCSSRNCKNIPEFSVTYWYSGFTAFLKMGKSGLPAMFCSRRAEETTRVRLLSQPGFPLKPAKASASVKHLRRGETRTQTLSQLDTTWGNGSHTESSLNKKLVKKKSAICAAFCNREFHCIVFWRRQNNFGVEDVPLLATGYQFQLYPHTPALQEIYKHLHGKTSGNNGTVPFQMAA